MNRSTVMEDILQQVQVVLCENGAASSEQSDRLTIEHLRRLVSGSEVRKALKRRGAGRLAVAVRSLQAVVADIATADRDLIERVSRLLRQADLETALARHVLFTGNPGKDAVSWSAGRAPGGE
jgi:hypothetical protein